MTRRVITYGLDVPDADVTAADVVLGPLTVRATVKRRVRGATDLATSTVTLGSLTLNVPGRHNLQNALATMAVGLELDPLYLDTIVRRWQAFTRERDALSRKRRALREPRRVLQGHVKQELWGCGRLDRAARLLPVCPSGSQ